MTNCTIEQHSEARGNQATWGTWAVVRADERREVRRCPVCGHIVTREHEAPTARSEPSRLAKLTSRITTIAELGEALMLRGWVLRSGSQHGTTWAEIRRGDVVDRIECRADLYETVTLLLLIVAREQPGVRGALGSN